MKNRGSIPQIKNEEQYESLKDKGYSKQKAARIANTQNAGKRGGKSESYENWSKQQLYEKAAEVGIDGRSKMKKDELIHALRNN